MKTSLLHASVLGMLALLNNSYSADFANFKLGPVLQERTKILQKGPSPSLVGSSLKIQEALFPKPAGNSSISMAIASNSLNNENQNSLLYQKILETIQQNYQQIGSTQTESILQYNSKFNMGAQDFSGINWQRPMGSFSIAVNRQILPSLLDHNWIVQDTFSIHIDASTFLNALKSSDLIQLSDAQLRAFAGVVFKRHFEYYHYAASFEEGLVSDFSKLFLAFTKFTPNEVISLPSSNILKRRDEMSFNAGGYLQTPSWYGLSATAGALVKFQQLGELTVQAVGPRDSLRQADEFLRISSKKEETKTVGAAASVQLDFFQLLKITILSADLEYDYTLGHEHHLSFYRRESEQLKNNNDFKSLLQLSPFNLATFQTNIVQVDERLSENLQSDVAFLLFGNMRSQKLEQYTVVKDGQVKTFYKDHQNDLSYVQSPLSKIWGYLVQLIFKVNSNIDNMAEYYNHTAIEYEAQGTQNNFLVHHEEQFSLEFNHQLKLSHTKGSQNDFLRREAVNFMALRTELSPFLISQVRNEELIGPLNIQTSLRVLSPGLKQFHQQSENLVYYLASNACRAPNPQEWANEQQRNELLRGWKKITQRFLWWSWEIQVPLPKKTGHDCTVDLGNKYRSYIKAVRQKEYLDLSKLRIFVTDFYKKSNSYEYLKALFGENNVFVFGSFEAQTKTGLPYQTYFKTGDFVGLGVIDNYQRDSGVGRTPASIFLE